MHESNDSGRAEVDEFRTERRVSPTLIGFAIVAVATLVFIVQNTSPVRVRFLFLTVNTRVWAGLLVAMLLGVILDRLLVSWWRRRHRE